MVLRQNHWYGIVIVLLHVIVGSLLISASWDAPVIKFGDSEWYQRVADYIAQGEWKSVAHAYRGPAFPLVLYGATALNMPFAALTSSLLVVANLCLGLCGLCFQGWKRYALGVLSGVLGYCYATVSYLTVMLTESVIWFAMVAWFLACFWLWRSFTVTRRPHLKPRQLVAMFTAVICGAMLYWLKIWLFIWPAVALLTLAFYSLLQARRESLRGAILRSTALLLTLLFALVLARIVYHPSAEQSPSYVNVNIILFQADAVGALREQSQAEMAASLQKKWDDCQSHAIVAMACLSPTESASYFKESFFDSPRGVLWLLTYAYRRWTRNFVHEESMKAYFGDLAQPNHYGGQLSITHLWLWYGGSWHLALFYLGLIAAIRLTYQWVRRRKPVDENEVWLVCLMLSSFALLVALSIAGLFETSRIELPGILAVFLVAPLLLPVFWSENS